jgi:uncharacterized protein (DUF2384 family)
MTEESVAAHEPTADASAQTALGMARLMSIAIDMIANSTASEAAGFDIEEWLARWINRPQPALGGKKPADLIGTPVGLEAVCRVLGAIESGAYQ